MGEPSDPERSRGAPADPVEALVFECLERMESEGEAAVESVCRRRPEHAEAVRRRLGHLRRHVLLPTEESVPERFGEFRILKRLGGGGMGTVYLAEQESLRRHVAVKVIRADRVDDPGMRARFLREIETVARLEHPGIVPIYGVSEDRGAPFFVMKYVRGCTLAEVLEGIDRRNPERLTGEDLRSAIRSRLGLAPVATEESRRSDLFSRRWVDACLAIARQVAEALEHVHRNGILHRDVKPSNVFLTADGQAVLIDFGLAWKEGDPRLTRSDARLGSLPYMSPEQVRGGSRELDARTDVYGIGVTLYEMLALRPAYLGETPEESHRRVLEGFALPIRALNRAVPKDVETVCLTAMDRDRERRYASARSLGEDLDNLLARRPVKARPPSLSLRSRRWVQRHPTRAVLLALAAVLVVGTVDFVSKTLRLRDDFRRRGDILLLAALTADIERYISGRAEYFPNDEWFVSAEGLVDRLPHYRERYRYLQDVAPRRQSMDGLPDFSIPPTLAGNRSLLRRLASLPPIPGGGSDPLRERVARRLDDIETRIRIEARLRLEDPDDQLVYDELSEFVPRLEAFARDPDGLLARMRHWATIVPTTTPAEETDWLTGVLDVWRRLDSDSYRDRTAFSATSPPDGSHLIELIEDFDEYAGDDRIATLFGGIATFRPFPARAVRSKFWECPEFDGHAVVPDPTFAGQSLVIEFAKSVFGIGGDLYDDFDGDPMANGLSLEVTTPTGLTYQVVEKSPWAGCAGFLGITSPSGICRAAFRIDAPDATLWLDRLTVLQF